jgi:Subtilase family
VLVDKIISMLERLGATILKILFLAFIYIAEESMTWHHIRLGQYTQLNGTSFAAAFVTGTIALLWSIFPNASATTIINSVIEGVSSNRRHRSIIPPLLNGERAMFLQTNWLIVIERGLK